MSDKWDFYFAKVNDTIASLFVDLGIRDIVPDPDCPWLLWCWVHFRQPREDGLSSAEEAPILHQIEDALTSDVIRSSKAELVGRITTAGRREFYFYGPRPDGFEDAVQSALKSFPEYEFDFGAKKDAEWSTYLDVLYPTPEDFQRIKNHHVIEVLEKHGDPLKVLRAVSHWVYFQSSEERSKFIAKAIKMGFKITNEYTTDKVGDGLPYGVTIERDDRVDWDSINEVTLQLFRLSRELGGDYDGWETSIEKNNG